jgi:2-hydroxychromene-2-carboxylate isomerase
MTQIRFYFEFASPYSYIASCSIEDIGRASGRQVLWLPIDIREVWTAHGVLDAYTAIRAVKRPYIMRDAVRCARKLGITLAPPSAPARDTSIAKLVYWGLRVDDELLAKRFLQAVWHRYFAEGGSIGDLEDLAQASLALGLDMNALRTAAQWAGAQQAQDACNVDAVGSGCFGVPWFVTDGESFFGHDRLSHLAEHVNAHVPEAARLNAFEGRTPQSPP